MLSPADTDLCARDPALPGLAAILDAGPLLRNAGLGGLRASYLRYKPGTSCVAGLSPTDGGLGAFAAMSYPPTRYAEVRARPEWQAGPEPVHFLDDICTALVPLSRDRRLKAARMLHSPADRDRLLDSLGLKDATLTLLRYKPGRRLVLRADAPCGLTVVIKVHARNGFPPAVAGARHAERFAGAPLNGIDRRHQAIVSRWIEGDALDPARHDADAFRGTGAELARLHHAAPCPGAPVVGADPGRSADALAVLLPDLAGPAGAAASAIARSLAQLDPAARVIHGDFSADQVVLRDGPPVVIDWDRMSAGDPARDLGSFLARLDVDVIEGALPEDVAASAGDALLRGYADGSGATPAGVEIHRAAALLALVPEGFRRRRPEWRDEAEAILARVKALTGRRRSGRRWRTPGLADALDPAQMGPKLATAVGAFVGGAPSGIRLLRHKEGRRALVRYDLADGSSMLGKLRAKGPDRRTPKLHRALRDAGLDGRPPDRVGVPEPLGEIDAPALWLQRLVSGRPLTELLGTGLALDAARCTGRALAMLHDAQVPAERTWSMADEFTVLDRALSKAAVGQHRLRSRIDGIRHAARSALDALPPVETAGIHRDFYPDQVLIDGGAVWLVDLDLYARGDPTVDVGNFLAHLTELGLRLHDDPRHFGPEGSSFVAGYNEVRGAPDGDRLGTLHWVSLIRHIGLSQRLAGRDHTTGPLVSICGCGPRHAAFVMDHGRFRQPAA